MVYKQEVCFLMKNILIINGDANEANIAIQQSSVNKHCGRFLKSGTPNILHKDICSLNLKQLHTKNVQLFFY